MEKILLGLFFSALAGFITAALSIVKLVNEKENKTSEFRQSWTNSVRSSISDLTAKLSALTYAMEYQVRLMRVEKHLAKKNSPISEKRLDNVRDVLLKVREDIASYRHGQYQAYSLCRLHFKPDDPGFRPIEESYKKIQENIRNLPQANDDDKQKEIVRENIEHVHAIVADARIILKGEWERVKEGERAYKKTKSYSLWAGAIMVLALLLTGGFSISLARDAIEVSEPPLIGCWRVENVGGRVFKINSCSGQVDEFKEELAAPGASAANPTLNEQKSAELVNEKPPALQLSPSPRNAVER